MRSQQRPAAIPPPPLQRSLLRAGMRLGVAVSGGADSIALLRLLAAERECLGLGLSVLHVHHGIRGAEADLDAAFVRDLASSLDCAFLLHRLDTPALARDRRQGLEETARQARYDWFFSLLDTGGDGSPLDAVATAHTLDDQAETVLQRLLRGAWTEGLGGIHPVLATNAPPARPILRGTILRPMLGASRAQITAWLQSLGQPWREDSSNADLQFTRNRIRHTLLPELATYNPAVKQQLAHLAEIARDEEHYWEAEVARTLPGLLLPGRAVRGGGRASSTHPGERALAFEVERLRPLPPALVRRLLRAAARQLGVPLDFEQTARLYALLGATGSAGGRREGLTAALTAERTPRELRLVLRSQQPSAELPPPSILPIPIPGEGTLGGWRLRLAWARSTPPASASPAALLRVAQPGDRVQLRHSRGAPKKIKEVLERMGVPAPDRAGWPVLEWSGEIVAMAGAVLEPTPAAEALSVEFTRDDA